MGLGFRSGKVGLLDDLGEQGVRSWVERFEVADDESIRS
jgi:hypothetical protein